MDTNSFIKRNFTRVNIESDIQFAKTGTEDVLSGKMGNISDGGMYFVSNFEIRPSSDVCIWLGTSLPNRHEKVQIFDFYRSKVRWCRELRRSSLLGVGVEHVVKSRIGVGPEYSCAGCDKKIPMGKVHFVKNFIYLCETCHEMLRNYDENSRAEFLRYLDGNIF